MEKDLLMLLDNNSRNVLSILEIISEKNQWYSIVEVSQELDVVERTTQRYIQQLNDMIDTYNEDAVDKVTLFYEKYKGIYLETSRGSNYNKFKQFVLSKDETLHILRLIFFEEFYSVTRYSMEYFVSESKIRKSLKKIKRFLNKFNLSLSNINFQIAGEEKQVRLISIILAWVSYKGSEWPFENINEGKIYASADKLIERLDIKASETQRKQMAFMLAVNLIRFRKNHTIPLEKEWDSYVNIDSLMRRAPELKSFVLKYNIHVTSEIYFYTLLMQMKVKMYESDLLSDMILSYHKKMKSDVYVATTLFLEEFSLKICSVPKNVHERFFVTSFCAHMYCRLFRHIKVDIDGYDISSTLVTTSPVLASKLAELIDSMHEKTGNILFEEKEFLIQKYMILFSSLHPLTYFEPSINILVESDLPYLIKQSIINKMLTRYENRYNLTFLEDSSFDQADIVLTNIPNIIEERKIYDYTVHYFDYPIRMRDSIEFDNKIKHIHDKKSK